MITDGSAEYWSRARRILLLFSLTLLPACAVGESGTGGAPLAVWAAASTSDAVARFGRIRSLAGGVPAIVTPDATSRLASQLQAGAPADVFVSADRRWMAWAVEQGVVEEGTVRSVAGNRLVVATATTSALQTSTWETLAGPNSPVAVLGLAGEAVPAGRYARQALESLAGVRDAADEPEGASGPRLVTGGSVRGVAEWAAAGEVDAAVIYASDAAADPRLRILAVIPDTLHTSIEILAGVVRTSPRATLAADFVEELAGPLGRTAFQESGFGPPAVIPPSGSLQASPDSVEPGIMVSAGSAVWISVRVALLATLLSLVPAVLLGWLLARRDFRGKAALNALLLAPMVVPPVVTGFLLLWLVGAGSPVGRFLNGLGLALPFSFGAAVLAAAVVGFPLFVITVRNAFETVDPGLEEMARTLGSPPAAAFRRVTLPLARSGIAAGMILAFARALGEFGATVVLAGNLEGETRTIALAVYTLLEAPAGQRQVWVLVGASVAISFLALAGFESLSRRQRALVRRGGHA